jgi:hypothetical protein
MFTGDFTQKKKVDLGGKRKELDRGKLLEQAKAERERRAREKLERVSATKIQVGLVLGTFGMVHRLFVGSVAASCASAFMVFEGFNWLGCI